ncbi:MAG TPA: methyltransferase [Miltoncostaeaceae bacterium]|nr:methyltransferase [Miltoncostaeaceae bacterium]
MTTVPTRAAAEAPAARVHRMATAGWMSIALSAAARLGLADAVDEEGATIEDVALRSGTDPARLARLLRALAGAGVFAHDADGRVVHTDLSRVLRRDHPVSLRSLVTMLGEESLLVWTGLVDTLRGGPPAFDRLFGAPFYEYLGRHPDKAETFDRGIEERHAAVQADLAEALPLEGVGHLVDVGGGGGVLAAEILRAHPGLRVTLVDRPTVAARAAAALTAADLGGRGTAVAGDFFAALPAGADAYLVASTLHNWPDPRAVDLLRVCRRAMRPDSRLLLVELVVPPGDEPHFAKLLDLGVMLLMDGAERTLEQHGVLLAAAGLRVRRTLPAARMTVIEAVPEDAGGAGR